MKFCSFVMFVEFIVQKIEGSQVCFYLRLPNYFYLYVYTISMLKCLYFPTEKTLNIYKTLNLLSNFIHVKYHLNHFPFKLFNFFYFLSGVHFKGEIVGCLEFELRTQHTYIMHYLLPSGLNSQGPF